MPSGCAGDDGCVSTSVALDGPTPSSPWHRRWVVRAASSSPTDIPPGSVPAIGRQILGTNPTFLLRDPLLSHPALTGREAVPNHQHRPSQVALQIPQELDHLRTT